MESSKKTSDVKEAVGRYAQAGLRLIRLCSPKGQHRHGGKPCDGGRGKVPLERDWQKQAGQGCDDLWRKTMESHRGNYGFPIPPGAVALDADSLEDFKRLGTHLQELGLGFWCQRTGRGGHFILRSPASGDVRNSVRRSCDGITYDVRGVGGQIVVYPSVHFSGRGYQWLVAPWELAFDQLSVLPEQFISSPSPEPRESDQAEGPITEGQRNDALFREGCSMRAKGASEAAIWAALQSQNIARCLPPLSDDEVRQIAASAARYEPGSNGAGPKPPPVDVEAELSALREKWAAATNDKERDDLLNGVLARILACSVLERERALEDIQKFTSHPRRVLNKVLAEQTRQAESKTEEEHRRRRMLIQSKEMGLVRVNYDTTSDRVNEFFDRLVGVMLRSGGFYNHFGGLTHVRPGHGLILLTEKNLPGLLSSIAEIAVTEMGEHGPEFKGFKVLKAELASAFINSPRMLGKFQVLNQYTRAPVFDADWNPVFTPGYHEANGIFYDGPIVTPVETTSCLRYALDGFSWKSPVDEVNYLGMLLTGLTMPHWPGKHPMAAYNASKPGTGKSTCARVSGLILEGKMPVTLSFNPNDEEFEKHLATRVGLGDRVVIIDNAKRTAHVREVESPVLERSITDPVLNYRRLGANQAISRANDVIFSLTMNYTKMSRDLRRRSVPINLFVEENVRDVRYPIKDIEDHVEEHRLELLAELAGMVTRRITAGRLELEKPARHSISSRWAETIDGILRCSGFNGFLDNFEESEHAFDTDYQLLCEICLAHQDQSALTASEWAALLVDNILEARLKEKGGTPKPLRSQATIVGNLFNQYLDTPIELDSGKYLIVCEEHGRGHPNTYRFRRLEESQEAGG